MDDIGGIPQVDINKYLFNKLDSIERKLDELIRETSQKKVDKILNSISFSNQSLQRENEVRS